MKRKCEDLNITENSGSDVKVSCLMQEIERYHLEITSFIGEKVPPDEVFTQDIQLQLSTESLISYGDEDEIMIEVEEEKKKKRKSILKWTFLKKTMYHQLMLMSHLILMFLTNNTWI